MGFMDKAKKMAEQAQAKLDEAQKQFNTGQEQDRHSGPAVEYDAHGRPIAQTAPEGAAPPHGDPLAGQSTSTAPPPGPNEAPPTPGVPPTGVGDPLAMPPAPPIAQPGVAPTAPERAAGDAPEPDAPPARPEADAADEDRNNPSHKPPTLSSGDPLAG